MAEPWKDVYKCIRSIIPTASTYVFSLDPQSDSLKYEKIVNKDEAPKDASGYVTSYVGDSGSLYWKTEDPGRAIAIAIVSSKVGPKFEPVAQFSENPELQCNQKATKVTEDIVQWIKEKSNIPRRGTKRAHDGH